MSNRKRLPIISALLALWCVSGLLSHAYDFKNRIVIGIASNVEICSFAYYSELNMVLITIIISFQKCCSFYCEM